jgi:hypothetical protein
MTFTLGRALRCKNAISHCSVRACDGDFRISGTEVSTDKVGRPRSVCRIMTAASRESRQFRIPSLRHGPQSADHGSGVGTGAIGVKRTSTNRQSPLNRSKMTQSRPQQGHNQRFLSRTFAERDRLLALDLLASEYDKGHDSHRQAVKCAHNCCHSERNRMSLISTSNRQAVLFSQASVEHGFGDETTQETDLARQFSRRIASPRSGFGRCFQNRLGYNFGSVTCFNRLP